MQLKELRHGITHLFYPRLCEGCGKPLLAAEDVLCIQCGMELPETGFHHLHANEAAIRFAGRIPFQQVTSFAYFSDNGLLQHLLHGLKYKRKKQIGIYLGKRFAMSLIDTQWIKTVDFVIPVPLHKQKEAIRGYNQSVLIAEGMSGILKIPLAAGVLLRVRHTESQTQKTRAERLNNMQDAFQLQNMEQLKNKHVLLLDDVLTTGATLEACALTLLQAEGIKVSIATIGLAD